MAGVVVRRRVTGADELLRRARWETFTARELRALDEFFTSFAPFRNSDPQIRKLGGSKRRICCSL